MNGKILTLEGIYGQIVDAHEAHPTSTEGALLIL
jgi:hypothetical protein